ncbi:methylated-DNA--[protein]-cysteine S-methyltransferase [Sedimentitalea todarodis]|uniref:Methylated-DNA--[protein]-cysteine S-methyltransferase n=1 Tax=Sedimentitalea todarodis TaxID=1631240 RepID=A0ABU3V8E3_9RHOB|nr:methylated-DNA--[protein]-cysteine S-methyltransferase [Sedimentitalea todarodis]MDU9002432.1 methylated-DNA--[protein]-cysteine S-methyltransferase [Sedimentitalea todarodis]
MRRLTVQTPTGDVTLTEMGGAITLVIWGGSGQDHTALLDRAAQQLMAYFEDPTNDFDVPLKVEGSAFQHAVCDVMRAIPVGHTRTYGDIARDLNAPPQAVGQACGGNPIPIIIPCHRVLAASGLGGFSGAGGVETKVALLRHEGAAGLLI